MIERTKTEAPAQPAIKSIEIDGRRVAFQAGETILEVAQRAGIEIPTLCHDPRLDPAGACRSCLVDV